MVSLAIYQILPLWPAAAAQKSPAQKQLLRAGVILLAIVLGSWLERLAALYKLLCPHIPFLQTGLEDTSLLLAASPDAHLECGNASGQCWAFSICSGVP